MSHGSMIPQTVRFSVALCLLLPGMLLGSGRATAQTGGPQWTALTPGAPAGTPAEVRYDPSSSNLTDSFFDVFIHGFWTETVVGEDQNTYTKIEVPGIAPCVKADSRGAPSLPAVRGLIALGNDANEVRLGSAQALDLRSFAGFGLVWPDIIPVRDHEEGTPERFVRDESIYGLRELWPPADGLETMPVEPVIDGINGALFETYPCKWNPLTGELTVAAHFRFQLVHGGNPALSAPMTKERGRLAAKVFHNWPGVEPQFPINTINYTANFLFIYPPGYRDELLPLINQKKARGFAVSERTTAETGQTCASIRAAILDWYNLVPSERDKYLLLVGDTNEIPLCTSPSLPEDSLGVPTDDLYGTVTGGEIPQVIHLIKEIHHGRLSVDSEADCANQVEKILDYEDHPSPAANHYDDALLVAHREEAPEKYVGAHESVRTASYAVAPVFHTRYGNSGLGTNSGVRSDINDGMGVVAYRGHGSSSAWTGWNFGNQYFQGSDIDALTNGSRTPVVLSFACTNSYLYSQDCISERWMEKFPGGAVAAMGATTASWTTANHELDRKWFKAIYDEDFTTITHAMEWAELEVALFDMTWGVANTWMYMLLGDPDMQIRRENPNQWLIVAPEFIPTCPGPGGCPPLEIQVLDEVGSPVEEALVAAWKPAAPGASAAGGPAPDEVFDNRYTGLDGRANIPGAPVTTGWITYTVQDDAGNAVLDSIEVRDLTGVTPQNGRLAFAAHPSVTRASTSLSFGRSFDVPVHVVVYDVTGRVIREVGAAPGASGVVWNGADQSGRRVASGLYLARFVGEGLHAVTRIVVTR